MITIGKPYITSDDKFSYLKAKVTVSGDTVEAYKNLESELPKTHWRTKENYPPVEWSTDEGDFWFSVPKEYGEYLRPENSDAFLVAMLWYAMETGSDIECTAPVSEKLYFGVTELLIPALCKKKDREIVIKAKTVTDSLNKAKAVGTGMSCGIDSLYTLEKYTKPQIPEAYRLNSLTYFNMGAIFHPNTAKNKKYSIKEFYEITDKMSEEKISNAESVAKLANMPLISMKSNFDKDYYRGAYGYTGVYRNCAMVLALQGYFNKYYCSSAGWPEFFDLSLNEGSEHYETLLCDAFSTESCQFIISDYCTRWEKTELLSKSEYAKKFLDVCFNFHNCGSCSKCYRTLLTLDILGEVDGFGEVFDVKTYKNNRDSAYLWLLKTIHLDSKDDNRVFADEIYAKAKEKGVIPKKSKRMYRSYRVKRAFKNVIKFLKRAIKFVLKKLHLYK